MMLRREFLRHSMAALPAISAGHTSSAEDQPGGSASPFFDVRQYGATGDGRSVDSPAVNAAIEAAAAAGGGTVYFAQGTYVCFTIRLRSNITLYLSSGCVIEAAASPQRGETTGYRGGRYDLFESSSASAAYQDFGHCHWRNSLFYAEGEHDFSVVGPGLIFGKGLSNGHAAAVGGYTTFHAEQPGVGNKVFGLKNCRNVILRDFRVLKGGHFALLATGVDNLIIENLLVDTDRDGFDIDCCRNVRVSGCTVNSPWDDAICPKSSYALGTTRNTANVTIANNYVTGYYELGSVVAGSWKRFPEEAPVLREGRIKCGTESNGGFQNIVISGNVIEGCKGIALESADGALIEDVVITNNTMRDIVDAPIFLNLNRRNRGPVDSMQPGGLRRILISNLVSSGSAASSASVLAGIPGRMIEDVKVSDCFFAHEGLPKRMRVGFGERFQPMPNWQTISVKERETDYPELLHFGPTPCHGFFIRHLARLEMSHVEIAPAAPDPRPAFWLEDVHRADFFAITAPAQKNFALRNITDFRLGWSRAAADQSIAQAESTLL